MNTLAAPTRRLLLALGLSHAASAQAAGNLDHYLSMSLEELMALEVTISTDIRQTVSRAPAVVTVITADDIRATGATNLVEVLEGVPGIHVRAGAFAFRPLVHMRGANATQTLLMVDGAEMKDLLWGFGIYWKGLPASMIERVEILRGPGSALFGADASAGVINVITRTAGRIEDSAAGLRLGSFDSSAGWLRHGTRWNGFDIALTAELSGTDGHDPFIAADAQRASDRAAGSTASLAPAQAGYGWRNEDVRISVARGPWRLQADHMRHGDLEIGLTGAGVLDPLTRAGDRRDSLCLLYGNEQYSQDWGLDAELRLRHLDYTSGQGFQERPPGYDDGTQIYPDGLINRMQAAERALDFEFKGLYRGFAGHRIRVGLGHSSQDLYAVRQWRTRTDDPTQLENLSDTPEAFAPEQTRRIDYLFAQDVWTLDENWELTAGARHDRYSDFGDTFNPRAALVWRGSDRLTTKLMYGQAFRAPSYQELYAVTSRTLPNPGLEPERSKTWDLSFTYAASKNLAINLDLFRFEQYDLIAPVGSPSQFRNNGRHTLRGIEVEAHWQAGENLRVSGNYTMRDQDDSPFKSVYVPDREAYLRADWAFRPGWNWNLQANWIGERPRAPGDTRADPGAYTLVDTTLRYTHGPHWEFAGSIRNLLDADARAYTGSAIPDDLPLPGRNAYIEIRYIF